MKFYIINSTTNAFPIPLPICPLTGSHCISTGSLSLMAAGSNLKAR